MNAIKKFIKNTKNNISITIWTIKLAYKITPLWFSLRLIAYIFQELVRIASFYFASVSLQELVNITQSNASQATNVLVMSVLLYALSLLVINLLGYFDSYSTQIYNYKLTEKAIPMFLTQMTKLDMQYHEDDGFKTMAEKAKDSLSWQAGAMIEHILYLTAGFVSLVSLFAIFSAISPILIILIAIPVLINFIIENKYGRNIYDIWSWQGDDKKEAVRAYYSLDDPNVLAEAKIYGFGGFIANKFQSVTKRYTQSVIKNINKKFGFYVLTSILDNIIFIGIQIWTIALTIQGILTIQIYSFYLSSLFQVSAQLSGIQNHVSRINEFGRYMADFRTFLNLPDKIEKPKNPIKLKPVAPLIEFRNVSFKYPNSEAFVLKNLDFKVEPGQKIALIGENGAGKTTLIKLLARFYDPVEGDIYINDQNLKNLELESYYKLWGILFQQFARYWFTLRENIGLGNIEDIQNKPMIEEAAHKAGLQKVIQKLPHGLENMLSTDFKDGKNLSGGEWQKVGIARGLFANPKLIILDEPTSALDALAEQEVFEEIQKISVDTTMIIVSHRFATVRNADKILVLENGKISEQGSHEELMQNQGLYYKMFTTQAEGYK